MERYEFGDEVKCGMCCGSGEGAYEGSTCRFCYGTGKASEARARQRLAIARQSLEAEVWRDRCYE